MQALKKQIIKSKAFSFFQKLGSALILPISILPVAGIFLSIGTLIEQETVQLVFYNLATILFFNLPTLILISVSFKFSDNSGEAALFALVLWFVFLSSQSIFITDTNSVFFYENLNEIFFSNQLGIRSLSTSIFGGIILGLIFAFIYSKISKLFLHINFLLRRMFISGIMMITGLVIAFIFLLIWPLIYIGIYKMGEGLNGIPFGFDAFLYGTLNRLLLPFGMHSLLIPIMIASPVGGTLQVLQDDGTWTIIAEGDSQIWIRLSELGIPLQIARGGGYFQYNGINYFLTEGTNPGTYQQGFFPIMIFAFPAAAYGITRKMDDKKQKSLIWIAAITPMLTGITEPFEYLFVFLSPTLYIFHALATGISFMLLDILNTSVWLSSGWFVDIILFGIIPQLHGSVTNYWSIFIVGPILSIPYYLMFNYFYKYENKIQNSNFN